MACPNFQCAIYDENVCSKLKILSMLLIKFFVYLMRVVVQKRFLGQRKKAL